MQFFIRVLMAVNIIVAAISTIRSQGAKGGKDEIWFLSFATFHMILAAVLVEMM